MKKILETEDSKYILLQKIGYGGTCSVYKGYCAEDKSHKLYAIKIFKPQNKKYFEREIFANKILPPKYFLSVIKYGMGSIHQENINYSEMSISEYISTMNDDKLTGNIFYKIEEIAKNGELFNYIYELGKGFSEQISAKIFSTLIKTVKILHENNIIHGDIKPENILIGNDFSLKLIDFGFSRKINKNNNNIIYNTEGTETYSSPEITKAGNSGYDGIKSDIFSLGVLLFVITIGRFPFNLSQYSDKKYRLIMTKKYDKYWAAYEKYNLSKEFKDLMNHLVCFNPNERFSIDEILEHSWIKKNVNYNGINKDNKEYDIYVDEDVVKELKERKDFMEKKTN